MTFLQNLIYWETLLILLSLFAVIASRILAGAINTAGLLYGRTANGEMYFSPERVQLLLFTLGAAFQYMTTFLQHPTAFPQVSAAWLALLGSSHAVYLGGKAGAAFLTQQKTSA
jgi:hypothetical protein